MDKKLQLLPCLQELKLELELSKQQTCRTEYLINELISQTRNKNTKKGVIVDLEMKCLIIKAFNTILAAEEVAYEYDIKPLKEIFEAPQECGYIKSDLLYKLFKELYNIDIG